MKWNHPYVYLSTRIPPAQIRAAVAWLWGIAEAQVSITCSSQDGGAITDTTLIVLDVEFYEDDFPLMVNIIVLKPALEPADLLGTLQRLCEKLGCQALTDDFDDPSHPFKYILVNRLPRCQRVKVDGDLCYQGIFCIAEYGELL